eukprot:TRINITY_DN6108_c0_g1_i1.p1 TRINITY_DN6108_c0_g1~~TRINITY_DN6108_c0_g1_i1.p1  ORF type:complete len:200 (-),score=13.88 TRINITY_DN6108_c0_g1_i1:251-850(-)
MLRQESEFSGGDYASERSTSHLAQASYYSECSTTFSMPSSFPTFASEQRATFIEAERPSEMLARASNDEHLQVANGVGLHDADASSTTSSSTSEMCSDDSFRSSWSGHCRSSRGSARAPDSRPVVHLPMEEVVASARAILAAKRNEREGVDQARDSRPVVQNTPSERSPRRLLPTEDFVASARAILAMAKRNEREGLDH